MIIIQIVALLVGAYLLFYSLFWLSLTVLSLRKSTTSQRYLNPSNPEILLILPAYKPGKVFFEVMDAVESASRGRDIQVYVLLQEAANEFHEYAARKGFYVEEKIFHHLGGNSYQHALRHISKVVHREQQTGRWSPEFVMLVDKDNILTPNFFDNIPEHIYEGYDIIQGKRSSLDTHTPVAFFDSITEALNDGMFRIAKEKIGGMIEISGSGALIETDLFLDTIHHLDPNAPGFDKNFMVQMLTAKRQVRAIFWPASELKEEKTYDIAAHDPQRLRWFGEQYYNALFHGRKLLKAFREHRRFSALDYFVTLWRPPRSVQFAMSPLLSACELLWKYETGSWPALIPVFTISFVMLTVAVLIFLKSEGALLTALKYSVRFPTLALHNIFNALRSVKKENRGTFIHTTHRL